MLSDESHLTDNYNCDTRPGLQPIPSGRIHLVGGGPQHWVCTTTFVTQDLDCNPYPVSVFNW